MKTRITVAGILLCALPAMAQTTAPAGLGILSTESIFSRMRLTQTDNSNHSNSDFHLARVQAPAPVLVGVLQDDQGYVAFLRIASAGASAKLLEVREGETIGWDGSRVQRITWDGITVSGAGKEQTVILVGNDLRNQRVLPATPNAEWWAREPIGGESLAATEARMRARRVAELGAGG